MSCPTPRAFAAYWVPESSKRRAYPLIPGWGVNSLAVIIAVDEEHEMLGLSGQFHEALVKFYAFTGRRVSFLRGVGGGELP